MAISNFGLIASFFCAFKGKSCLACTSLAWGGGFARKLVYGSRSMTFISRLDSRWVGEGQGNIV